MAPAATGLSESYLYDDAGLRMKKTSNGTTTYYLFPHYEVSGSSVTKYYFFGGQRVAMKRGTGALTYLHQDHLSSTALSTTSSGAFDVGQGYRGYGNYRTGGSLPTDHRYTGQKLDIATGLMYYNARYYDRTVGHFISPDTLVPDPTSVWDYNRFMYVRGNLLKYNDPTGHTCLANTGGSWDCPQSPGIGGSTQTIALNLIQCEGKDCIPGTPESPLYNVLPSTYQDFNELQNPFSIVWTDQEPVLNLDQNILTDALAAPLMACAQQISGVCGLSFGGTWNSPSGAGVRWSGSIYVDEAGAIGVFGELGGGAYTPWLAPEQRQSVVGIPGATVMDMDGMAGQFGMSGAVGPWGIGSEAIFLRSDRGKPLIGQAYGVAQTWRGLAAEGHMTFTYAHPLLYVMPPAQE